MSKPRVFIGFGETAGYCAGLKKGFDEVGVESVSFMVNQSVFQYDDHGEGSLFRAMRKVVETRDRLGAERKPVQRFFVSIWQNIIAMRVFCWALLNFDAFVIQGRTSFADLFRLPIKPRFLDLPILRLFRKRIIYVFHGTDSRPAYVNGAQGTRKLTVVQLAKYVRKQHRDLRKIEKYASVILHYPLNAQLHAKKIVSHEFVGRPVSVPNTAVTPSESEVLIAHAPSDPLGKGTAIIEAAVQNIARKGHAVRLIRPADKSNAAVKQALAQCDFVIDQVYYDVGISYVATEAAFLGKPTVIGTNAKAELLKVTPTELVAPTILCEPEELERTIERLVSDKKLRVACGDKARAFVEKHYGPRRVAENYLKLISGAIPKEWIFDSNSIDYVYGYGYSVNDVRERVRSLVQQCGPSALCLDDKPAMKAKFLKLAE